MSNNQNDNIIRVTIAVVDERELTLYKEDGDTVVIKQGDPRVTRIVEEITPILLRREVAVVNLDYDRTAEFANFEKKTNGAVKFFRVLKDKLKNFLGQTENLFFGELVEPQTIGAPAEEATPAPAEDTDKSQLKVAEAIQGVAAVKTAAPKTKEEIMTAAVADVMKHATPVTSHHFDDYQVADTQEKYALVAKVDDNIIPNAQHLHGQIKHANSTGESTALVNFMQRAASVKRGHSVDDLMKFVKHGDLPFAEDGSIIIYKRLQKRGEDWVDVHSGKVTQRVGDYVCMDPEMVDHNRRQDCSNGLHVARRQYLGTFSGDVMILAKVAPEDVIAVPQYDANKMRVCGYHILFEVSKADASKLNSNRPITPDMEAAKQLAAAIAGQHVGKLREVRITEQKGGGLKIRNLDEVTGNVKVTDLTKLAPVGAIEDQSIMDPEETKAPPVKPADVLPVKAEPATEKPQTRAEKIEVLWQRFAAVETHIEKVEISKEIVSLKRAAKVSWFMLGFTTKDVERIESFAVGGTGKPVKAVPKKKPSSNKSAVQPKAAGVAQKPVKAPKPVAAPATARKADDPTAGPSARIAALLPSALEDNNVQSAELIFTIKKTAKKSWDKLGVSEVNLRKLELLLGKK